MSMKVLFDIFIEFITLPIVNSVIGVLSFISAIVALFVAYCAYKLQQKSNKDLNRIEDNINQMRQNVKQINKIIFEIEKNRLASYWSKEHEKVDQKDIHTIFYENQYRFNEVSPDKEYNPLGSFTVKFIKEQNGLPKMNYPFSRPGDFPYFCVYVIKKDSDYKGEIRSDKYYYLSLSCDNKNESLSWYMAEKYPIDGCRTHKGFKIIFEGTSFSGEGLPPASDFCKNC